MAAKIPEDERIKAFVGHFRSLGATRVCYMGAEVEFSPVQAQLSEPAPPEDPDDLKAWQKERTDNLYYGSS